MATYTKLLKRVSGRSVLAKVELEVASDYAASGTDYHTVTLRRRGLRPDGLTPQTYGDAVVTWASSTRSLTGGQPVALTLQSQDANGFAVNDGETLWLTVETTGSPAALDDPRFILSWQRKVG